MTLRHGWLLLGGIVWLTWCAGPRIFAEPPADNGVARTPPMGWHPWNQFGEQQDEKLIREIADAMVARGMKDAGYQFVGPDCGWANYSVDAQGILHPRPDRFPAGPKAVADYVHRLGFKEVAYSDVVPKACCGIGLAPEAYEKNALQWAQWGADYLKLDYCGADTSRSAAISSYTHMREALKATGRPILYSICEWGHAQNREPWEWADTIGNMWRTTTDINPGNGLASWADRILECNGVLNSAEQNNLHWRAAGPGRWNDPDMLCVGLKNLSAPENRSHFSFWCMMAAPLIAGNDVRTMSDTVGAILTNIEVIAVDQDPLGVQGHVVRGDVKARDSVSIWAGKPLFDGSRAALILNSRSANTSVRLLWTDVGLDTAGEYYVRDLWNHTTAGPLRRGLTVDVPPHDTRMFRISGTDRFPVPPILVASTYDAAFHTVAGRHTLVDTLRVTNKGSSDLPLWKLKGELPPWLRVSVIRLNASAQAFVTQVSTAGLAAGSYHALVTAGNTEPVSGLPMSTFWYDVHLDVSPE